MKFSWYWASLLVILAYGLWGFFAKLATLFIPFRTLWLLEIVGMAATVPFYFALRSPGGTLAPQGVVFGLLAGVVASVGTLFFALAVSRGKASVVVPLTALYPVVTILLGIAVLQERLRLTQSIGVGLAVLASLLLAL